MNTTPNSFIIVLLALLISGCGGNRREAGSITRKVKIELVLPGDTIEVRSFSGLVQEAAEVGLAFRVAGPIAAVHVKEGDFVRKGQLIAQMDPRDYEIQVAAARAQYNQVKAEVERVTELFNRRSVSANEYDKAVSGLQRAEVHLRHTENQLNDTRLAAPAQGYIQRVNFRQGELIDAGMPVATLIDASRFQVEVDIPVSLFVRQNDFLSFSGIQPAIGNTPIELSLLGISPKAGHNQLFRLHLSVSPSYQAMLAPGMDIQVDMALRSNGEPTIPLTALFKENGNTYVWIYQEDKKSVNRRQVVPGKTAGEGSITVVSGLAPGEQVVVAGTTLIREADRVEPLASPAETNVGGLL